MQIYARRNDAIHCEITMALGDMAREFNIDAIADATLSDYADGYALAVDPDTFWCIVEANAL